MCPRWESELAMASMALWRCQFSIMDRSVMAESWCEEEEEEDKEEGGGEEDESIVERIEYSRFTASEPKPYSLVRADAVVGAVERVEGTKNSDASPSEEGSKKRTGQGRERNDRGWQGEGCGWRRREGGRREGEEVKD